MVVHAQHAAMGPLCGPPPPLLAAAVPLSLLLSFPVPIHEGCASQATADPALAGRSQVRDIFYRLSSVSRGRHFFFQAYDLSRSNPMRPYDSLKQLWSLIHLGAII